MIFFSPSRGRMTLEQVGEDILDYVSEDTSLPYKLIVGSDSQLREATCFVTAIIIHRIGKGARYYYTKKHMQKMGSVRQRIFYEASLSLSTADRLVHLLHQHGRDDLEVEIHLDVGLRGDTRDLIKDIIGMIVGSGFDAKIKPEACGASKVADKYTK
ncbi:ribonuclease H-like YkuK family protein [Syntrophothermus lipocalidus]|uniref:DUF458 domain-containing protein n=1 Tax=Syntrophothermus lipocalidus (strain DSM 12680 / TGB-C1) TaxID=643648 RepID=D7CIK1_SYNLT|nr:ribonuclease H-like YkuK family protein [Syntrophothermus lipocalidus]ADI00866.1 protein of unknown function DUF458 [Syntrophothermus lipocalidus DSM 12680]